MYTTSTDNSSLELPEIKLTWDDCTIACYIVCAEGESNRAVTRIGAIIVDTNIKAGMSILHTFIHICVYINIQIV